MMAATLIICSDMLAQEYDTFAIIAEFLGNASAEDIDPEEVERLERYIVFDGTCCGRWIRD